MFKRLQILILTAILLLAAAVRILHINQQSLWIDEGATWYILKQPDLPHMWTALATRDHHPPFYYLSLKGWTVLAGHSVLSMRLFSAFCSLLSVAAVYPLAKTINRSRRWFLHPGVPILASLMLALSDPEFVLAQDTRMYALRTLLVILSVFFYLRWIQKPNSRHALGWIVATVALLHTQYQGLFVVVVEGLHMLLFLRGRQRWQAIGLMAINGALFAPWFLTIGFNQRLNDPGFQAALPSNWQTLSDLRLKYFSAQWPLMIGLLLLGSFALINYRRVQWRPFGPTFLLWGWILFTVIVTFVGNLWYPILAPHRILLISPAIAILTAQGLRNIPGYTRGFLIAVILIYGVTTVDDYYPKEPWNKVGEDAALYAQPGEMVLQEIYRGDLPLTYYLDNLVPPDTEIRSMRVWREYEKDRYPGDLINLLSVHPTVWLVHWSPDNSAFDFLAQTGHIRTATLTVDHWGNQINVYRYDLPPEGEIAAFTSGMKLLKAEIIPDQLRVDLWWSADQPLPVDYSVSAFLLDANGKSVAQHDSFPLENRHPTTTWQPGEIVYDPHPIQPIALPPGQYTVAVQVYTYFDGQRYPLVDGQDWAAIGTIEIP